MNHWHYIGWAGWILFIVAVWLFIRGANMIDVTALEKEVADELAKEEAGKAKEQLKRIEKDIRNAKQIVENLERRKKDLLVAISEGTN
jgi:ABC-type uncharacterized transport system substrate-binding protein